MTLWQIQNHHTRNHGSWPQEECHKCKCDRQTCLGKIAYQTRETADEKVTEINEGSGYQITVVRYLCRWCDLYHLTGHNLNRDRRRRVERARRKWLIKGELKRRGLTL